jgi:hypothetical protein
MNSLKIITAHQPAYLPWLGFFHKVAIADAFVILDNVQFEKNSFTNRNKIKTPNGDIWLTVPVLLSGHTQKNISNIEIDNNHDWRRKHWKSIYLNYKKTPYFCKYSTFFENLYKRKWEKISELTENTMNFFFEEMGIKTKVFKQSELEIYSKKHELLLSLCKQFNARLFIFGKHGKDYADIDIFRKNNIEVYFQEYTHPDYPQLYGTFIPYMSIVDLLFNCGPSSYEILMKGNIAKKQIEKMVNPNEENSCYSRPS